MAIAFRSVAIASSADASGTPIVVTKPAGVVDGDVMVAFGAINSSTGTGNWTPPAGWTSIADIAIAGGGQLSVAAWWKVAASEGASYTWSNTKTLPGSITIAAYSGCAGIGVPDSAGAFASTSTSTATPVTGTTTTVTDLDVVVAAWLHGSGAARTINSDPAGYTNRSINSAQVTVQIIVDDKIGKTPAGLEGAQTITLNATTVRSAGILIGLAPGAASQVPYQPVYQSGPILAQ